MRHPKFEMNLKKEHKASADSEDREIGVICDHLFDSIKSLAAAFWTVCKIRYCFINNPY